MSYYKIESLEEYFKHYKKSIREPRKFWGKIAEENFTWYQTWEKVMDVNLIDADIKWFTNAKLNITKNCIDRHLNKRGDKNALIFEPNNPEEETQYITYNQLYERVCQAANGLKKLGVEKGDRVCIYLPMIPELAILTLACARIGAIHSVVFAGFSSAALASRIVDCDAKLVITSDGSYRGEKQVPLKSIVDEAVKQCPSVQKVMVVKRTNIDIAWNETLDVWFEDVIANCSKNNNPEVMDAEDVLFILYTSGSTGKPKGMVHTTAGYMVYAAYSFANIFDYKEDDIYWCTADIGWITGHTYLLYGPLLNGATTVMYEGIPTYPDYGRLWQIVEKLKVTQFYTAPTLIRSLAKESTSWVDSRDLSSLKVIASVGEPLNEEAWHWYNNHVGKKKSPVIDSWWQTETGGIMLTPLPFITPTKPTYVTLPMPGIYPVLMDERNNEIEGSQVVGSLCIKYPWPSMARTIWNDHKRFKETYFSEFPGKYFSGDGALRDEVGYYRITGRVDDVVIVSGHNLGTAPIEDAINEHPAIAESAIVGYPHEIKGNALYGFITIKETGEYRDRNNLMKEINQQIANSIGPIAKLDKIQFVNGLPKTRSGKIMRRILRKIAEGDFENYGDISTLLNPEIVIEIEKGKV